MTAISKSKNPAGSTGLHFEIFLTTCRSCIFSLNGIDIFLFPAIIFFPVFLRPVFFSLIMSARSNTCQQYLREQKEPCSLPESKNRTIEKFRYKPIPKSLYAKYHTCHKTDPEDSETNVLQNI